MIAACGMNCSLCIGHLREKNPCGGCYRKDDPNKPASCRSCSIVNCESLSRTDSGCCYECERYPCTRLKRLDKRYRTKYRMSMLENLEFIKSQGIKKFLSQQEQIWTCPACQARLSCHREKCLQCGNSAIV